MLSSIALKMIFSINFTVVQIPQDTEIGMPKFQHRGIVYYECYLHNLIVVAYFLVIIEDSCHVMGRVGSRSRMTQAQ